MAKVWEKACSIFSDMGDKPKYLLLLLEYGKKLILYPDIGRIQRRPAFSFSIARIHWKFQTISCHYWIMVRADRMGILFHELGTWWDEAPGLNTSQD
jgi:hypothetical protein